MVHRSQSRYATKSDNAFTKFPRIANPESCYWHRRTDNLVLYAKLAATSGNVKYLNDFKLCDTTSNTYKNYFEEEQGWSSSRTDNQKEITIIFDGIKKIQLINIWQGQIS